MHYIQQLTYGAEEAVNCQPSRRGETGLSGSKKKTPPQIPAPSFCIAPC